MFCLEFPQQLNGGIDKCVSNISGSVIVCISDIQANDPAWYQVLTANLTTEQQKALQEVMVLADQRKAAAESKRIEQSGGKYLWK